MGGRGTFASGNSVALTYQNVEKIHDVWAVEGVSKQYHSLPAESHKSNAYIKLNNGVFREMRIYDENHFIKYEIAYHKEKTLTGNNFENVLHIHEYKNGSFNDRPARFLTKEEFEKYKKYFKGVVL